MRSFGNDGLFDWDFLAPCFERGIMPMDFDAVIEVNGYFIIFETKAENTPFQKGQLLTLATMAAERNKLIICVSGKSKETIGYFSRLNARSEMKELGHGWGELQDFVRRWFVWADGQKRG